jgi:hypothetical protein
MEKMREREGVGEKDRRNMEKMFERERKRGVVRYC